MTLEELAKKVDALQERVWQLEARLENKVDKINDLVDFNEDDWEDEWESEPDTTCPACGFDDGHMKGCPEDNSPYAQLLRDGYD